MNFDNLMFDDHLSMSTLQTTGSGIGTKRDRSQLEIHDGVDEDIFESTAKKISLAQEDAGIYAGSPVPPTSMAEMMPPKEEIKPFPFFYYKDHSTETDPDPLTPLTPPGRVPNFPAKMHSILSRQDLADIISWMPHGRSWRVLKPREFEVRVIPTYFEHAKFSSFIRQANGWGFRRITQGRDRNSYYHPMFLRGLPHLCKKMKRPGVSEKQAADPDHEPDLYKISEMHPVPEKADDESILLQCTLQGGPKARMPVYSNAPGATDGSSSTPNANNSMLPPPQTVSSSDVVGPKLTPSDQHALAAFQQSLGASENQLINNNGGAVMPAPNNPASMQPVVMPQSNFIAPMQFPMPFNTPMGGGMDKNTSPLAVANQLAFANPNMAAAFSASSAASQFAAGFAAATALSHQQFQAMLSQMGIQPPSQQQHDKQQPQQQQPQQQQQQGGKNNTFPQQQGSNNNTFPQQQGSNNNTFPQQQGGNNNTFPQQQGSNNNTYPKQQGGNNNNFQQQQQGGNNNNFHVQFQQQQPQRNESISPTPIQAMNNSGALF